MRNWLGSQILQLGLRKGSIKLLCEEDKDADILTNVAPVAHPYLGHQEQNVCGNGKQKRHNNQLDGYVSNNSS